MPRARLSVDGIDIAKSGYNVDTASLENMQFSSSLVAARIYKTGVVTPAAFTGYLDGKYKRAVVDFDDTFPHPPIVLVCGLNSDGTVDQSVFLMSKVEGSTLFIIPFYEIRTFVDRFELYVWSEAPGTPDSYRPHPSNWRYWVLHNTLET